MAERDQPERPRPEDDDEPAWVTALVAAGGALGMNRVRLRWKLRGWVRRRREDSNRLARKVGQVRYQHRVCGHCTAVNDRDEKTCQRCGRPLDVRAAELAQRVGLPVPRGTPTTLLCVAMVAVFVASVLRQQLGDALHIDMWSLAEHGANLPGVFEPVRDLTSLLVHGGVFHLLVGLFTVAMAASLVERELSPAFVLPLFLLSGGIGAAGADWMGRDGFALGMGSAGGVIGLLAAGAVLGQRAGTRRGLTHRNELLSVALLVVFLGLFVDTDYRAMLPAAAVGAVVGAVLPRQALAGRRWALRAVGLVGAAALVALAVLAVGGWVPGQYLGDPPPMPFTGD